jgi:hypothetical protein
MPATQNVTVIQASRASGPERSAAQPKDAWKATFGTAAQMRQPRHPQATGGKAADRTGAYPRLRTPFPNALVLRRVIPNLRLGYAPTSSGPPEGLRGIPRNGRANRRLPTYPQPLLLLTLNTLSQ